ncbi:MAG: hypothetical protein AB7I34_25740, partial [Rhizobiaceae bacterium]
SPAINQQGWVQTWVTSRWKNPSIPGQLSTEINTDLFYRKIARRFTDKRGIPNDRAADVAL